MNRAVGLGSSFRECLLSANGPLWKDGVYGRRYLRGPHKEDNEIQLLSVTAEGHEELYRPGVFAPILPG